MRLLPGACNSITRTAFCPAAISRPCFASAAIMLPGAKPGFSAVSAFQTFTVSLSPQIKLVPGQGVSPRTKFTIFSAGSVQSISPISFFSMGK